MKTMMCKQMGGPCNTAIRGISADDVIKAQDVHLKAMVSSGDTTHESATLAMKERWKHPIAGMGWYLQTKKDFASLP
jgi:hypothetical protein